MNYADWKRVYIDRSLSLKDWQNQRERGKIIVNEKGVTASPGSEPRKSRPKLTPEAEEQFAKFKLHWAEKYNVKMADELKYLNFASVQTAARGIELVL